VYVASQSGTAERLAKKLAKQLKIRGHSVEVIGLDKVSPAVIAEQKLALFIASTYGEGEPPEHAQGFRDRLFADDAPILTGLRYAVFCLGDRNYEHFCRFGIELDERLHALGASRIADRVESDVDVDEPFASWAENVTPRLQDSSTSSQSISPQAVTSKPSETAQAHTRDNPFRAGVKERRTLTAEGSSKQTIHVSFALDGSSLKYEAGDACGVLAKNDSSLVEDILSLLPFSSEEQVDLGKVGKTSLKEALEQHLQVTLLTRKMVRTFAERAQCPKLTHLLGAGQESDLDRFLHGRGLIDLLEEYPGAIATAEDLVTVLPRLSPRLYSISSSPKAHKGEVHCTVGVVRYRSYGKDRGGVASTMLADRIEVGSELPIYIQPNKRFRLPADGDAPIIMIGPGTGIAPFRGFLHERRELGHTGRNWLFFGERSANTDFLYQEELCEMHASGHLTRLDTAFSRDQVEKIYVQDRMQEHGAELWRWLNDGASVYVCGDASRMAKDVDAALHSIVRHYGGMNDDAACEYVANLHEENRYHRDVY
jgi:sulfite reductase (NADPH) flavoprotein alpha-component